MGMMKRNGNNHCTFAYRLSCRKCESAPRVRATRRWGKDSGTNTGVAAIQAGEYQRKAPQKQSRRHSATGLDTNHGNMPFGTGRKEKQTLSLQSGLGQYIRRVKHRKWRQPSPDQAKHI
jgi:hypothetical protein